MNISEIKFLDHFIPLIKNGLKTQTMRPVKNQPAYPGIGKWVFELDPFAPSCVKGTPAEGKIIRKEKKVWCYEDWCGNLVGIYGDCPYGVVGDRLIIPGTDITLEITNIRVDMLNNISDEDAEKEGIEKVSNGTFKDYINKGGNFCQAKHSFRSLWNSIYSENYDWYSNPWVWVIEFRRVKK